MLSLTEHPVFDVNNYVNDGFTKVCEIGWFDNQWFYKPTDFRKMYKNHCSWVYFIVVDNEIVKVGETGNHLALKDSKGQDVKGSKSRLGRYINGDRTDQYIRESLRKETTENRVSIWARELPYVITKIFINNIETEVIHKSNMEVEKHYLDLMRKKALRYPLLNKGRK